MSLKPICVPCQRFFRPHRNGRYFIEGMPNGTNVSPGTSEPENWRPYKLWCGDQWVCYGCGAMIIVGTGRTSIREHYQSDFQDMVDTTGATFQVNDC